MRGRLALMIVMLPLSGCGGGEDPLSGLCVAEAERRLEGQVYRLDEKKIVAGKPESNGNVIFSGSLTLKPGTSAEVQQTFDCTVAPAAGDAPARVIAIRFNISGSGLAE